MLVTREQTLFIGFVVFLTCSLMGQVSNKKDLTEAEYNLWSTMSIQAVAPNAEWLSYNVAYKSNLDTLFVTNKAAIKKYAFPKGYDGRFANDNWFACMQPERILSVLNVKTGALRQIEKVINFGFSSTNSILVTLTDKNELSIGTPDGIHTDIISNVNWFEFSPSTNAIVYTVTKNKSSLHYYDFKGRTSFQKLDADSEAI